MECLIRDMSLVGPRPNVIAETNLYTNDEKIYSQPDQELLIFHLLFSQMRVLFLKIKRSRFSLQSVDKTMEK